MKHIEHEDHEGYVSFNCEGEGIITRARTREECREKLITVVEELHEIPRAEAALMVDDQGSGYHLRRCYVRVAWDNSENGDGVPGPEWLKDPTDAPQPFDARPIKAGDRFRDCDKRMGGREVVATGRYRNDVGTQWEVEAMFQRRTWIAETRLLNPRLFEKVKNTP